MEKRTALPNDFPTDGVELRYVLVTHNYAQSLAFYCDVLGATVVHELPGILCFLSFAGSQILLSASGGSMQDKTNFLLNDKMIMSELSIRVPDCLAAYTSLCSRGAEFITPPAHSNNQTRAFFHDPDGHLLEIWEA
ncbi:VOC family protein [Tengunoibacter tsumagoiensis]|uniref:Glyoxalase n=1 Tax=Tengunoibacter tsumagoiensis TaxID=2014871 RepID=A0A402A8Z6_9CHLR|nr:VOC family protein [Tengunoibacter tsumagoiensis]GCE15466.1 glyoxalase [Tengunoibacter tsumagoiensis]